MKLETKIIKVGNSLGIIIPSLVCKSWKIEKDSVVVTEIKDNEIIITKED